MIKHCLKLYIYTKIAFVLCFMFRLWCSPTIQGTFLVYQNLWSEIRCKSCIHLLYLKDS